MKTLESRITQLEELRRRVIAARQPKISLSELYVLIAQRIASGEPPFRSFESKGDAHIK